MGLRGARTLLPCLLAIGLPASAASSWRAERVSLPAAELARAAGLEPSIERWRLVHEVARRSHPVEGDVLQADRRALAVRAVLASSAHAAESILVPLPLTDEWWSATLGRTLAGGDVVREVLSTRRAALLYRGLVRLDPETLQVFARHAALAHVACERRPEVFVLVAPSLRVRGSRVELPGGRALEAAWEELVGASATRPERFLRLLLEREDGRLAVLLHALQQLDEPQRRYALALDVEGPGLRREHFAELAHVFARQSPWWKRGRYLVVRPLADPAAVLTHLAVTDAGALAGPRSRAFWEAVFAGEAPGDQAALQQGAPVRAAWLAGEIGLQPPAVARTRLMQLAFGQRVFGPGAADAAAIETLQGLARRPALVLVLERLGARDPALYVALLRAAEAVERVEGRSARLRGLASFEGALALVDVAHHRGAIDGAQALALARSLAAVPVTRDGLEHGAVGGWLERELVPALRAAVRPDSPAASAEDVVLRALAGAGAVEAGSTVFDWEGLPTRADPGLGAYLQLRRVRSRQGGPTLDEALGLSRFAATLAAGDGAPQGPPRVDLGFAFGLDDEADLEAAVADARRGQAGRMAGIAEAVLAGTLVSLAYAPHLGPAEGAALSASRVAQRHELAAAPFALAEEVVPTGSPWRARGSLLALETALARLSLRRVTADPPMRPPCLNMKGLASFARSVALRSAAPFRDGEVREIAAAVERGRARAAALPSEPGGAEALARGAGVEAWRAHALPWLVANQPSALDSFFTLPELMRLGGGQLPHDGWGLPRLAFGDGLLLGRPGPALKEQTLGQDRDDVAAALAEEPLVSIAVELARRQLPSCLAPALLGVLTQAIVDEGPATTVEDPLALAAWLAGLSPDRWDDAISALAGNGPLVPARAGAGARAEAAAR